ncbi:MAG: type II 3-dehydroquinate dehydratase [Oscillospiraceae bacterium]|jgi:3-dehydroquinate dehydratase-2|nr:type II 3-dehydroquinate dehydratase [Oscillospiraceae bacterium]
MKFMLINGPNLNLLGIREKNIYGTTNYASLIATVEKAAAQRGVELECRQSNIEGRLVDFIQEALTNGFDGIIINPAAYTHTSVAILDALKAVNLPAVEVHISNIHKREEFRRKSMTAPACAGQIAGMGIYGYVLAMDGLINYINARREESGS